MMCRAAVAVVCVASSLSVAGCGRANNASPGGGIASLEVDDAGTLTDADAEDQFAGFQDCMAEKGFEIPDLGNPTGNSVAEDPSGSGETDADDWDPDEFDAAAEACQSASDDAATSADAELTPEQQAALDDHLLEMERCFSDNGLDLPLVDIMSGRDDALEGSDFNELAADEFETVWDTCEEKIGVPPELEAFDEDG